MTRREFITLLAGAAATWPLGAHSQPTPLPLIGFLNSGSPAAYRPQLAGFHQGLRELGFNEGQNVTIEYRWADGEYERLPELASDLVGRKVAIIVATGGSLVGRIAKAATQSIPIVFTSGADPILSRRRAKATGATAGREISRLVSASSGGEAISSNVRSQRRSGLSSPALAKIDDLVGDQLIRGSSAFTIRKATRGNEQDQATEERRRGDGQR